VCVQDKTARELALDADHRDVADYLLRKLFFYYSRKCQYWNHVGCNFYPVKLCDL